MGVPVHAARQFSHFLLFFNDLGPTAEAAA
jgi:hypothetical protein